MTDLNKIIKSLSLANTDTRDDTIKSIIETILYSYGEKINKETLGELIKGDFSLELYSNELEGCIAELAEEGVINIKGQEFELNQDRHAVVHKVFLSNKDEEIFRKETIYKIIDEIGEENLTVEDKELLRNEFSDYLYECFFQNGKEAIYFFLPKKFNTADAVKGIDNFITKSLSNLGKEQLKSAFKKLIEIYPERISSNELAYLENLSKKAEKFFSLGLSKEGYEELQQLKIFEWTFLVDTNFLYSILNLHSHPENNACKQIIKLSKEYSLNLKFQYTKKTLKELIHKKDDFQEYIPKDNFTKAQIKALLNSGKLDSFSRFYYEKKIHDFENTPHPSDIISDAQFVLKANNIMPNYASFEHLTKVEDYLLLKESEFNEFYKVINEVRVEKGFEYKHKDSKQVEHDVFLREAILSLRSSIKSISINDIKYFGLTLDKTLLKFDRYVLGKKYEGIAMPTFFLPSFLLKKIVKFLPVITDDYRRAFVQAVSSYAFDNSKQNSIKAQKSLQYFKNLGIEDERIILGCISNQVFLNQFSSIEVEEEKQKFVESELNKVLSGLLIEKDDLQNQITQKQENENSIKNALSEKESTVEKIKGQFEVVSGRLSIYEKELKKLSKRKPPQQILTQQPQLPFNDAEVDKLKGEIDRLKKEVSDKTEVDLKRKQNLKLMIIALITIGAISFVCFFDLLFNWPWYNQWQYKFQSKILLSILLVIFGLILSKKATWQVFLTAISAIVINLVSNTKSEIKDNASSVNQTTVIDSSKSITTQPK